MFDDGDDVIVDFAGAQFPGEVLKVEASGFVLCRIHNPERVVAVRMGSVRKRD